MREKGEEVGKMRKLKNWRNIKKNEGLKKEVQEISLR